MKISLAPLAACTALSPAAGHALQVGYALTITTVYADGDPFPDRIDQSP